MNKNFDKAAHNLIYYFRLCAKSSGTNWDSDNDAEVMEILEYIYDGVDDLIDDRLDHHVASRYHEE
jgi:hypothetical protein